MTDSDPKSVIVKRKAEDTSSVPLIDCPKCGFWTPVDTYCASCGVEMATVKRKRKSSPLNPAVIAVSMALLAVGAFVFLRSEPTPESGEMGSTALSSQANGGARAARPNRTKSKQNTFMKAMNQLTGASTDDENSESADESTDVAEAAGIVNTTGEATSSAANALVTDLDTDPSRIGRPTETSSKEAKVKPEVLVAFLWVEVSKDWLHLMGASEMGFHSVPDLETRLRETQGGYNIISATRHRIGEKSEPVDIVGPERSVVRFDLTATPDTSAGGATGAMSLGGLAQTAARQGADGAIRAPTAAPITIEKGEGTIMNLGKASARAGGSASTGAEIVVLILPRWVDDRNP